MTYYQHGLNEKHSNDPQPGDYWHERFTPVLLVIKVSETHVEYLDATTHVKPVDENSWTWNFCEPLLRKTKEEFKALLQYKSIPRYWADVSPNSPNHSWAVLEALKNLGRNLPPGSF